MNDDEDHDQESIEIALGNPGETTGDQIDESPEDISMFLSFILFIFGFESPFEVVVAGDPHFDEFAIEPQACDDHEHADAGCDIEIQRTILDNAHGMSETEHESNICDVVCDGIKPLALMAWIHAHSGEFAVDSIDHGRDLPEDYGEDHEEIDCGEHESRRHQSQDEPKYRDHIRGNEGIGDAFADKQRTGTVDGIGDQTVGIPSKRFSKGFCEHVLGDFGIIGTEHSVIDGIVGSLKCLRNIRLNFSSLYETK